MKAVDTDGNGHISYNGELCRLLYYTLAFADVFIY
jgi:hypothetical protein